MPRPTLKLKPKRPPEALDCPKCEGWLQYQIQTDRNGCVKCDYAQELEPVTVTHEEHRYPSEWIKGQLLNNRNTGNNNYVITLLGEEFDPNYPERAITFQDSYTCQTFLSWWYAKEIVDPRAR